jgi:hypothetical protein
MVHINEKIIEKIDKNKCNKEIKDLLKNLLSFELENFDQGRWRYTEKYTFAIMKFLKSEVK